jgi:signal peptidase II
MTHPDPSRGVQPLATRLALLLAFAGIVLDQATKIVAEALLVGGEFVPLVGSAVGWQLVYNPGAAFGLPAPPWVFLLVTLLVVGIVVRTLPQVTSHLQAIAYGLLLSGAIGNLLDRVFRAEEGPLSGRVVDFVAWGSFPRFNVADACITVGFVLLVVALYLEERRGGGDDLEPGDHPAVTSPDEVEHVEVVDPGGAVHDDGTGPRDADDVVPDEARSRDADEVIHDETDVRDGTTGRRNGGTT